VAAIRFEENLIVLAFSIQPYSILRPPDSQGLSPVGDSIGEHSVIYQIELLLG